MEPYTMRFPKKRAGVGALIGLALGAFAAIPWGTFAAADSPGLWLAAPLVLGFTVLGAWFATVISFSALDEGEHQVQAEDEHHVLHGHHGHPTPA